MSPMVVGCAKICPMSEKSNVLLARAVTLNSQTFDPKKMKNTF